MWGNYLYMGVVFYPHRLRQYLPKKKIHYLNQILNPTQDRFPIVGLLFADIFSINPLKCKSLEIKRYL